MRRATKGGETMRLSVGCFTLLLERGYSRGSACAHRPQADRGADLHTVVQSLAFHDALKHRVSARRREREERGGRENGERGGGGEREREREKGRWRERAEDKETKDRAKQSESAREPDRAQRNRHRHRHAHKPTD
eukprot:3941056-Rhodomonas_salina.2